MADEELEMEGGEELDELEGEGGEQKKGGLPIKLIIIIAGALVVIGVGGFLAMSMFSSEPEKADADKAKPAVEAEKKEKGASGKPGTVLNLNPFIVNLADASGKRYLKLSLAVDAKDEKLKTELEARMPVIRDSILLLLTSKTFADISPVAGKIRLRNEILKIINRSLAGSGTVHAVYFTEFVVQ